MSDKYVNVSENEMSKNVETTIRCEYKGAQPLPDLHKENLAAVYHNMNKKV